MLWRSAIEALGRRRISPEATGDATAGFDTDCDMEINDGPPFEGGAVTDGAAAKLSTARSVPTEQSASATIARAVKKPDFPVTDFSIMPWSLNRSSGVNWPY